MLTLQRLQFGGYRSFPGRISGDPLNVLPLRPLTLVIGKNGAGKSHVLRLVQQLAAGICGRDDLPLPASDKGQDFSRAPADCFFLRSHAQPLTAWLSWIWNDVPGELRMQLAAPSPISSGVTVLAWRLAHGESRVEEGIEGPIPWSREPWSAIREDFRSLWGPSVILAGVRDRILTTYPVPQGQREGLGPRGQRCPDWLGRSELLREHVREWVGRNLLPSSLEVDASRGELRLLDRRAGADLNLADSAEGLHQVLPVVTLWKAREIEGVATLDGVEQPELHLHDALHGEMGDLALAAAGLTVGGGAPHDGRRLLVETHSEGLLLRVRRRIAEGAVRADQVSLVYVDRDARGSRLVPIPLTSDGEPESWPDGVFLERLVEARAISAALRRARSGHAV